MGGNLQVGTRLGALIERPNGVMAPPASDHAAAVGGAPGREERFYQVVVVDVRGAAVGFDAVVQEGGADGKMVERGPTDEERRRFFAAMRRDDVRAWLQAQIPRGRGGESIPEDVHARVKGNVVAEAMLGALSAPGIWVRLGVVVEGEDWRVIEALEMDQILGGEIPAPFDATGECRLIMVGVGLEPGPDGRIGLAFYPSFVRGRVGATGRLSRGAAKGMKDEADGYAWEPTEAELKRLFALRDEATRLLGPTDAPWLVETVLRAAQGALGGRI